LVALVLVAIAAVGAFGARGAFAAAPPDPAIVFSLSTATIPDGGTVTFTATVTGTAAVPTGTVNFIDAATPDERIGFVTLMPSGSFSRVASLDVSSLRSKATPYSIYAEYVPDDTAGMAGLSKVDSAPQTLTVGTVVATPRPTSVTLSAPTQVVSTALTTLTATVAELPPGTSTPQGKVQFLDLISGVPTPLHASDGSTDIPLNGQGVAQLTITVAAGPHQIVASYIGTTVDASSSSTAVNLASSPPVDITVTTETSVQISPSPIVQGDTVTITATVIQTGPGAPAHPTGRVIFSSDSIYGNNAPVGAGSAELGVPVGELTPDPNQAILQINTLRPAVYTIHASYFGDLYDKTSAAPPIQLSVLPARPGTIVHYTGPASAIFGHSTVLSATVTNAGGALLAGRVVTFTIGSATCTTSTGTNGVASCPVVLKDDPQDTVVSVDVAQDVLTQAAHIEPVFKILPAPTAITAVVQPGPVTTTLTATLLSDGIPVANQPVSLALDSEPCGPVITNNVGVATCDVDSLLGQTTAQLTASFSGNVDYTLSGFSAPVTLQIATTTTVGTGPILSGATVTLTGTLFAGTTPLGGRTLHLSVGSLTCDALTNAAGVATCTVTGTTPLGPATTRAVFDGFGVYLSSNATSTTALLYAFANGGAFVVGDNSAAGAVTFWGAKWSNLNGVSGGAPDAFKGFALVAPTTCGTRWTTGPGNSPDPPVGPLPTYMAVLVTSSVTKSGSSISGTTSHIVIVKTDAGYKNDPGHAGTGTVVATVC